MKPAGMHAAHARTKRDLELPMRDAYSEFIMRLLATAACAMRKPADPDQLSRRTLIKLSASCNVLMERPWNLLPHLVGGSVCSLAFPAFCLQA